MKNDEKKRPNILFIMTEQHRGDCLGIEDHPVLLTPNIDNIGGEGVRFSKCYSTCPTCIAARRSLLSGQFPSTHGMVGYKDGIEWEAPPTLPGVLSEAGYHTCWVGRSIHQYPVRKRYGFDHMVPHKDYNEWLAKNGPEGSGGYFGAGPMNNDWTARPWHLDENLHQTNWTINKALEFLEKRDPSCPFFLCVSFFSAHPPLIPPAYYLERYLRTGVPGPVIGDWASPPPDEGKGQDISSHNVKLTGEALKACRAGYYGLINHVDDQLRRLLNPVSGIDRMTDNNTIVIFTSDHGEMLGDHYHWHKRLPYEPSARIPFLVRAPERFGLKQGMVREEPVCLEDIMPTILEMADVEISDTVEGKSVLPLMQGENISWRDYLHIEHSPSHQTLTDGREKYIWFANDGREQYFDLKKDPDERYDLISDAGYVDKISEWRQKLIKELEERPEGFSDGKQLITGCNYSPVLPHGGKKQ